MVADPARKSADPDALEIATDAAIGAHCRQ